MSEEDDLLAAELALGLDADPAAVARRASDPAFAARRIECAGPAPDRQIYVLHRILGIGGFAQDTQADPEKFPRGASIDFLQGIPVMLRDAPQRPRQRGGLDRSHGFGRAAAHAPQG